MYQQSEVDPSDRQEDWGLNISSLLCSYHLSEPTFITVEVGNVHGNPLNLFHVETDLLNPFLQGSPS